MRRIITFILIAAIMASLASCEDQSGSIQNLNSKDFVLRESVDDVLSRIQNVFSNDDDEIIIQPAKHEFDDAVLFSMGGYSIPTRLYYYITAETKSVSIGYSLQYERVGEDSAEFWNSYKVGSELTRREELLETIGFQAKSLLICMNIAGDYGYVQSDSYLESYQNNIENFGGLAVLNEYLAPYGMNDELLKRYYQYISLYYELQEYLYGDTGKLLPKDDEVREFYQNEYAVINQIVFSYTDTDENGIEVLKTEEEIAEARKRGEELYAKILEDGSLFDRSVYLTEDPLWFENQKGYLCAKSSVDPDLREVIFDMNNGDFALVETNTGIHIVRRTESSEQLYLDNCDNIEYELRQELWSELLTSHLDSIEVDEAQLNRYDFIEIPALQ